MLSKKTLRKFKTVKKTKDINQTLSIEFQQNDVLSNRFEIIETISVNDYAATYKAYDKVYDKFKTIKIYGKYVEVFNSLSEIRQEAKLLKDLNHNSLPIFDELIEDEYVFLVLDYIDGKTLLELIQHKIPYKKALDLTKQLADVLLYIHLNRVEHLDLKPENILITNDKQLFLTDFGSAATKLTEESNIEFEATLSYLSPEGNSEDVSFAQRDIFAFGIILYEIFYDKYPFGLDEDGKPDYKIPVRLIKSKNDIDKIIKRCISYFVEDRYKSFQEIIEDLNITEETNNIIYKTIIKYIFHKMPFKNLSEDFKKDIRYLWISLLALLLILPFFLSVKKLENNLEKEINIDAPPFAIYVNTHYQGEAPLSVKLKKDDVISFVDNKDLTAYEMSYNNQKNIRIDLNENKIFVNRKLKGLHYNGKGKISNKLDFLRVDSIEPLKLKKLKNKRLHIGFSPDTPDSLINYLPKNIQSLSLRRFKQNLDLNNLSQYKKLKSLDLSNSDSLIVNTLPVLHNLKILNLSHTNISRLRINENLKHLNIANNKISDLKSIRKAQSLQTIDLDNNNSIDDYTPLLTLPNIRQITNNNATTPTNYEKIQQLLNDNNLENLEKTQVIIYKKHKYKYLINFIVTMIMAAILVQIFRMIYKNSLKKMKNIVQDTIEEIPEKITEPPKSLDKNKKEMIQTAIKDKRWYSPENENVLFYLSEFEKEYKDNDFLYLKKKEVLSLLDEKLKIHKKRNEYEPIYLITKEINNYCSDIKYKKLYVKADKIINKKLKINWVFIRSGSFLMGDFRNKNYSAFHTPHNVELNSYKISDITVTNELFCEFLNSQGNQFEKGVTWAKIDTQYSRISYNKGKYFVNEPYKNFPVYEVNWYGAQRFAEWIGGRLPTEAEWEFAARAKGKNMLFSNGDKADKTNMNYLIDQNDSRWHSVFPVKSFKPNEMGIYEMSGNILEWCFDWYDKDYYKNSENDNPMGPKIGELKVVRGGAWCFESEKAMTFFRGSAKPTTRNNYIGFRVILLK